jgi:hypothetical protein
LWIPPKAVKHSDVMDADNLIAIIRELGYFESLTHNLETEIQIEE